MSPGLFFCKGGLAVSRNEGTEKIAPIISCHSSIEGLLFGVGCRIVAF